MNNENLATTLVTAGRKYRFTKGSVNPVIQRASSLIFDTVADKEYASRHRTQGVLYYGRRGTLTHFALQDALAELEGGEGCVLYPCGAAAVTHAILAFLSAGDHLLMTGAAYEPTQCFCDGHLTRMNVATTYYDPMIGAGIADLIQSNTKVVFLESPSSITMEVQDIPAMVEAVHRVNPEIVIIMDNTWSAGILFKALEYGVDISIQSGSKYIVGHSDAMLGTAVASARCWPQLREHSYLLGQMIDADTAYTASRGLRTLGIRLKHQAESSIKIATWLTEQAEVDQVFHPALPSCPGHEFFLRDYLGSSGLFSFTLQKQLTTDELSLFLDHFTYFKMAYSWGGFESLILANQPDELQAIRPAGQLAFNNTLIRLHIGLEACEDLIADLTAGFIRLREQAVNTEDEKETSL